MTKKSLVWRDPDEGGKEPRPDAESDKPEKKTSGSTKPPVASRPERAEPARPSRTDAPPPAARHEAKHEAPPRPPAPMYRAPAERARPPMGDRYSEQRVSRPPMDRPPMHDRPPERRPPPSGVRGGRYEQDSYRGGGGRPPQGHQDRNFSGPPRPGAGRPPMDRRPPPSGARPPVGRSGGGYQGSRPAPSRPQTAVKGSFSRDSGKDKMHTEAAEFAQNFNIPEAVAFQIVRGDFTLKDWMARHAEAERKRSERNKVLAVKKQQRGRDEGMAQQYFLKQKKNKTRLVFEMYEGARSEGVVTSILPYHFWVEPPTANADGNRDKIEKLQILYCYKKENEVDIGPVLKKNEEVAAQQLKPVREKEQRYDIPMAVLDKASAGARPIVVTLNDGTVMVGTIDWYSTYYIKLKVSPNGSAVIFNHSIQNVAPSSAAPAASRRGR